MNPKTDLYTLLLLYADKQHSPYIDVERFISFIERYAGRHAETQPEWKKWSGNVTAKFWSDLAPLLDMEKCKRLQETKGQGAIVITDFYVEMILGAYDKADVTKELPFPNESNLKVNIPSNQLRIVNVEEDLSAYLETPQTAELPIIKITFGEKISPLLALPSQIPWKLLEMALFKIRNYLGVHNNREYFHNKLSPQMQGREPLLREILNTLDKRPLDCLNNMPHPGEFTSLFWAYFYALIKSEVRKKYDVLSEDMAIFQASSLIHVCITFYKKKDAKEKEREMALKFLEGRIEKPPYMYQMKDIIEFTDGAGHLLLEQYAEEDLHAFIRGKTTEGNRLELPPLLIFHDKNKEPMYVLKTKIFPLCARLLNEIRPQIQKALSRRWYKLIQEYQKEPAMESDEEFEKLLRQYVVHLSPMLISLLEDKKLPVAQMELESVQDPVSPGLRFFERGVPLPLASLLMMNRKNIMADTRILLPFWYSFPILAPFFALFTKLKGKSRSKIAPLDTGLDAEEVKDPFQLKPKPLSPAQQLKAITQHYETNLVPPGYTLDDYLEELESKWHKLIKKNAHKKMAEDIRNLVKDRLRRTIRLQQGRKLTSQSIDSLASAIIFETSALRELDGQHSLKVYIQLLIVKLLSATKL